MALQLAPEQGWGAHWNAAHPDKPFTPIEVGLGQPAVALASQAMPATTQTSLLAASQGATVPSVFADLHIPVGLQGDAASKPAASDTSNSESLSPLSLDQLHFLDQGWYVVPSVANETGQGHAAGDDGSGFDVAGDVSSDWFFV